MSINLYVFTVTAFMQIQKNETYKSPVKTAVFLQCEVWVSAQELSEQHSALISKVDFLPLWVINWLSLNRQQFIFHLLMLFFGSFLTFLVIHADFTVAGLCCKKTLWTAVDMNSVTNMLVLFLPNPQMEFFMVTHCHLQTESKHLISDLNWSINKKKTKELNNINKSKPNRAQVIMIFKSMNRKAGM